MDTSEIREMICHLSGSGKKIAPGARRHGIYSTMTLPGLDDLEAVRDTLRRFDDFELPRIRDEELYPMQDVCVLDVGSNVGAMSFEFARRGAIVTGLEYREDRVALCNVIATQWGLNAKFFQCDLNQQYILHETYDVILCSSVDEYIVDVPKFYGWLASRCRGLLLLESNIQRGVDELETMNRLKLAGFVDVRYLGNGHSGGISRKRKLYRASL